MCKSIGILQDKNLQMLWPALSPSKGKAWVDCLCMERGERKKKEWPHSPAVASEREIAISLTLCSLLGIFLSPCWCTKCKQLNHSEALCCIDLQSISSLLQVLVSPVLSSSSWAATRSSKIVGAAQTWNRNQTSEPEVHAANKPSFSLSSEYTQQFLFVPNKSNSTLAFSLENSSLGFQFGLNLSTQINMMTSVHSFMPESNLSLEVILAGTFQTQSHGPAIVTNPQREGRSGGNPELQANAWLFVGQKPVFGSYKAGFMCLQEDLLCTQFADVSQAASQTWWG